MVCDTVFYYQLIVDKDEFGCDQIKVLFFLTIHTF